MSGDLEPRVARVEGKLEANTERIAAQRHDLNRIDRDMRDARELELERDRLVRADLTKVDAKVDRALERLEEIGELVVARFDQVDEDHAATLQSQAALRRKVTGVDWPTVLTVVTLVVVPVVVAIIGKG